jgi:alpha-1,6-mannosyltransferase
MALTSWRVAAVPTQWSRPLLVPAHVLFYLGLGVLTSAWLLLGRALLRGDPTVTVKVLQHFTSAAGAPFVFAAPLGRDLWAYSAQGHLLSTGLSPYDHGPSAAPGAFAQEVSPRWSDSPAPYGPLWLRLSQAAAWVARDHPLRAALLLRLPAVVGLALCCWAIPALANQLSPRQAERLPLALWLGVASPLMLVLGVGGGHNDLLMLGLGLAGVAIAARGGLRPLALGVGVGALGVLVKSPAAIAVAFTVPASLHASRQAPSRRPATASIGVALGGAGAALLTATALSGLGFGWMRQVNSDAQWVSWLSLPSGLTMLGKAIAGDDHVRGLDDTLRSARTAGEVLAVVVLIALWLLAARQPRRTAQLLALAFGVTALLGPSVQPWYYLWALLPAGLAVRRRAAVQALAVAAVVFPIMITPSGVGLESSWAALPVIALAVALVLCGTARR